MPKATKNVRHFEIPKKTQICYHRLLMDNTAVNSHFQEHSEVLQNFKRTFCGNHSPPHHFSIYPIHLHKGFHVSLLVNLPICLRSDAQQKTMNARKICGMSFFLFLCHTQLEKDTRTVKLCRRIV